MAACGECPRFIPPQDSSRLPGTDKMAACGECPHFIPPQDSSRLPGTDKMAAQWVPSSSSPTRFQSSTRYRQDGGHVCALVFFCHEIPVVYQVQTRWRPCGCPRLLLPRDSSRLPGTDKIAAQWVPSSSSATRFQSSTRYRQDGGHVGALFFFCHKIPVVYQVQTRWRPCGCPRLLLPRDSSRLPGTDKIAAQWMPSSSSATRFQSSTRYRQDGRPVGALALFRHEIPVIYQVQTIAAQWMPSLCSTTRFQSSTRYRQDGTPVGALALFRHEIPVVYQVQTIWLTRGCPRFI
jgi:hypothetical protein